MRCRLRTVALALALAASWPGIAAAATGAARAYKVTITKFELNNGTSWITVSSGNSTTLDIAAVNAGEAAGNFFAGLTVPDGTYTQVRVTISNTFVIKGNVGASYTNGQNQNGLCAVGGAGTEAECTVVAPSLPAPTPDNLPTTLTVRNGVPSHKIRVNFDVSNALDDSGAGGTIFPGNPTVTMTMTAL